jgi:hypothetical protein
VTGSVEKKEKKEKNEESTAECRIGPLLGHIGDVKKPFRLAIFVEQGSTMQSLVTPPPQICKRFYGSCFFLPHKQSQ